MPFFKLKSKQAKQKPTEITNGKPSAPVRARFQSTWTSTEIVPEEVEELIHAVTAEMKLRAEALDSPFLLLPFRPTSDPSSARSFIDAFFKSNASGSQQYRTASLQQELRLTGPFVLCSILKWCWGRIPKGVVSWPVYETFQIGEKESHMARNAFDTFVPLGSDSTARVNIIKDFFDLMAAVAAHGKTNGLGGRKLSRLAGWWAFEHTDGGKGFEGGYKSWTNAADASSHLFFAYLRSLSPDTHPSMNVIERIPRSLQALLAQTEYPPETPTLLQRSTPRVVMIVDHVSPTPFSLLRRAKHFEYRQNDRVLREYSEFEDPVDALTDECKRVLYAIATTNSSTAARSRHGNAKPDETWSSFTTIGFGDLNSEPMPTSPRTAAYGANGATKSDANTLRSVPHSRNADYDRPTTPSWGDFLSSGFLDEVSKSHSPMLLPPGKQLPPLRGRSQTPSIMSGTDGDDDLAPGELAAITEVELDDAFWWVWMTSLAGEEPNDRKAVFGRCALIETTIMSGKWFIMEEQVKGASPDPIEGAQVVEKKSRFSFTRRGRLGRKKSSGKKTPTPSLAENSEPQRSSNRNTLGPDQHAKIKAAAAALAQKKEHQDADAAIRRGRHDNTGSTKTNSVLTLGLQSEAGPAMKWANTYDKAAIRSAYLGSNLAGTGQTVSTDDLLSNALTSNNATASTTQLAPSEPSPINHTTSSNEPPSAPVKQVLEPSEANFSPPAAAPAQKSQPEALPSNNTHDFEDEALSAKAAPSQSYDAFDKEIGGGFPAKATTTPADRGNIAEHPAFRQQNTQTKRSPSPERNAAVIAARRALEGGSTSPESEKSRKLRKQPGQGGLKKLFGRNKDKSNRRSMDVHQTSGGNLSPAGDTSVGRKLSIMRKKVPESEHPNESPSPEPDTAEANVSAIPVMHPSGAPYNDSTANISRVDSQEQQDAEIAFARFDQGPMEDMPAAAPRESAYVEQEDEDAAEPPHVPRYDRRTPEPSYSAMETPAQEFVTPLERDEPQIDAQSEATIEDHQPIEPTSQVYGDSSKNRWELIRENAARRAANARASEETSTQSRPTESARTDDGETSGEETIESRVARIKARVAELTGNMDGGSTTGLRR